MDLVVDSELLQANQAVKTVFVHCTWYRRCLWTPHIIFNQIHDVEFLALFEHFAWFPNNVRQYGCLLPCLLPSYPAAILANIIFGVIGSEQFLWEGQGKHSSYKLRLLCPVTFFWHVQRLWRDQRTDAQTETRTGRNLCKFSYRTRATITNLLLNTNHT